MCPDLGEGASSPPTDQLHSVEMVTLIITLWSSSRPAHQLHKLELVCPGARRCYTAVL